MPALIGWFFFICNHWLIQLGSVLKIKMQNLSIGVDKNTISLTKVAHHIEKKGKIWGFCHLR